MSKRLNRSGFRPPTKDEVKNRKNQSMLETLKKFLIMIPISCLIFILFVIISGLFKLDFVLLLLIIPISTILSTVKIYKVLDDNEIFDVPLKETKEQIENRENRESLIREQQIKKYKEERLEKERKEKELRRKKNSGMN